MCNKKTGSPFGNWFSFWQNENTIYGKIRYNNLINAKPVQKKHSLCSFVFGVENLSTTLLSNEKRTTEKVKKKT